MIVGTENVLKAFNLKKKKIITKHDLQEDKKTNLNESIELNKTEKKREDRSLQTKNDNNKAIVSDKSHKVEIKNHTIYMDNFFNNFNLLNLLIKWKWHLLIVVIISVILSSMLVSKANAANFKWSASGMFSILSATFSTSLIHSPINLQTSSIGYPHK